MNFMFWVNVSIKKWHKGTKRRAKYKRKPQKNLFNFKRLFFCA